MKIPRVTPNPILCSGGDTTVILCDESEHCSNLLSLSTDCTHWSLGKSHKSFTSTSSTFFHCHWSIVRHSHTFSLSCGSALQNSLPHSKIFSYLPGSKGISHRVLKNFENPSFVLHAYLESKTKSATKIDWVCPKATGRPCFI